MITATLSGTEPAPQEIQYPILMKDKRDGQIYLVREVREGCIDGIALNAPKQWISAPIGGTERGRIADFEVYHGEITLKNS